MMNLEKIRKKTIVSVSLFFFSLMLSASILHAVELVGKFNDESLSATLTLDWSDNGLSFKTESKPYELLLIFNKPVKLLNYPDIVSKGSNWFENFVVSYDTIFFKLGKNSQYEINKIGDGKFQLQMTKNEKQVKKRNTSNTRLRSIKARLLFKQGKSKAALEIINQLILEQPTEISHLLIKADFVYQLGRRDEAVELVLMAEKLSPDSVSVKNSKNRFLSAIRPFFLAEVAQKDTCDILSERFKRIQFEARPFPKIAVGIKLSTYEIISHVDVVPVLADETSQAEIYANYEKDDGSRINLSLFINKLASAGLAGDYTQYEADSFLTMGLDIRRPNWEYFYSQVEANQKDRIRVRYQKALSTQFSYYLFLSYNQYLLSDLDAKPTSLTFQGGLATYLSNSNKLKSWMGERSYLGAGYDLDIEEPIKVDAADGLQKSNYTRWVSNPRINIGKQDGYWDFSGYFGYAFRIYGSDGVFMGGKILYNHGELRDFYLKLDRYSDENSCGVSLLTIGMKWLI